MSGGYTEGPLFAQREGISNLFMVSPVDDYRICTASYCTEADAKLYAAAPDLLEALKRARHDLVSYGGLRATDLTLEQLNDKVAAGVPRSELEFTIDSAGVLAEIDAAIAKALGADNG